MMGNGGQATSFRLLPREVFRLHHLYLPLVLLLCALQVWRPLHASEDFWAHAAVGRWIWQHRQIPRQTLFLWSPPQPWVAHSWLSQLTLFGWLSLAGQDQGAWLILVFTFVLVAMPFLLLWRLWRRRLGPSSLMLVPFGLAIEASRSRFQTRPELFTALFFTGLLIFLVTWRAARRRSPWMVPLLFVVWANFHAAVALGIVILGVTAACDLLQDRWSRRSWTLALVWLLSVAAVFVNPIGLSYWQALVPVGGSKFADIVEWTSPWNLPQFPTTLVIEQAVLLGLALAAWLANPGRRWAHLAWLLVLAGAFAEAVRFTWLLALTSLAVLAANAQASVLERFWEQVSRWRRGDEGARPVFPPLGLRRLVRWSLLTWLILGIFVRYSDLVPIHLGLPATLRQGGVCFLRRHPPAGHLLNDYENSSYLQWSFAGQPPLFIDLLNAYPDQVQVDYQDMVAATPRGRELLDQYPVDEIFLTVNRPGPSLAPLGDYLDRSPGWARAYAGFDGVIWVRRTPDQEPLWRHPELRTSKTFGQLELIGRLHD